jgi:hypothetical protein
MEIEYTARYLKDYLDIRDKRAKKDVDKVINFIRAAETPMDMYKYLDIKKYDPGLGGYRIRFGSKPEWRIRFDFIDDLKNPKQKIVQVQLVLPREKYEKYAHRSINESVGDKPFKIVITEKQLNRLMELNNTEK